MEKKRAEQRADYIEKKEELHKKGVRFTSLFSMGQTIKAGGTKTAETSQTPRISLFIKTDVEGTLEAILEVLDTYADHRCELVVVDFGVGSPTDEDVELAAETNCAFIILIYTNNLLAELYCFNVGIPANVRQKAGQMNVPIEEFKIIYRLVETLKEKLNQKLPGKVDRKRIGTGHVIQEFLITEGNTKKPIAGCMVESGFFKKSVSREVVTRT